MSDALNLLAGNQNRIFLSINKTPDISASMLWETLKVYIRGQIFSISLNVTVCNCLYSVCIWVLPCNVLFAAVDGTWFKGVVEFIEVRRSR